jgi:hypothetical protein
MKKLFYKFLLGLVLYVSPGFICQAQKVMEPSNVDSNWKRNYQPFRIAGNLYYVGTYDLASYLITGSAGNILINTGLASSAAQIKNNIERLGFRYADTKILLTTQAHYDHMGAMAAVKKQTLAKFYVNKPDAATAASGGAADYEMGKYGITFKPVKADKVLRDSAKISLGNIELTMLSHPGHTSGSCSFLLTVTDSIRSYKVLIANMPSIITDRKFETIKAYPSIRQDYAYTLAGMKKIDFDLWVASHAGQFGLHEKRKEGDPYNPGIFMDKKGFAEYLEELTEIYQKKLIKDAGTQ